MLFLLPSTFNFADLLNFPIFLSSVLLLSLDKAPVLC